MFFYHSFFFSILKLFVMSCLIACSTFAFAVNLPIQLNEDNPIYASADDVYAVGDTIIAKGNVRAYSGATMIECDSMNANKKSMALEAEGHVKFYLREVAYEDLTPDELDDLSKDPNVIIEVIEPVMTPTGRKKTRVKVTRMKYAWESDYVKGNLETGEMKARNFYCVAEDQYFIKGSEAERKKNGHIILKNAKVTTCNLCNNTDTDHACEHYSFTAGKAELEPNNDMPVGLNKANLPQITNAQKYWIIMSDNMYIRMFDVPVFWLPGAILPPAENITEYVKLSFGMTSEWGYFASVGKRFSFLFSDINGYVEPSLVYFSKRGFGAGVEVSAQNESSWTQINAFGIYDLKPNGGRDWEKGFDKKYGRYNLSKERFDFRLQHLSHLTNRLDLRAQVAMQSDNEVLRNYFNDRINNDQQATYLSLEYQFDRFVTSFYIRPRLNEWQNETTTLPEFRIDGPRQALFGGLYYQSENSINFQQMKFAKFDRNYGLTQPDDYENFRFDTLQMFYYPIKIDWLNLIPRAGARMTYYRKTSEQKVSFEDLQYYKWATLPDYWASLWNDMQAEGMLSNYVPYDTRGGSKLRVIGEIGLEANTKIYRTWSDYKNTFFELDGLRHVMMPYINYNYNPANNVNPDNILFTDQIDRYTKQHFVRIGMQQSLQTRKGPYYREEMHDIVSLENYFDYHVERQAGFSSFGNIGTLFKFQPYKELKFTSSLLLDPDPKNNHQMGTIRNGELVDRKGIASGLVSSWFNRLTYEFSDQMRVFAAYNINDAYNQRTLYSMGSSLTDVLAGTSFPNRYFRYQEARAGFEFPIPLIDDPTRFGVECAYDFETGYIRDVRFKVGRTFHCWDVAFEFVTSSDRNTKGKKSYNNSFVFSVGLAAFSKGKYLLKGMRQDAE